MENRLNNLVGQVETFTTQMKSLPTVEQNNLEAYMESLRKVDPELYLIRVALNETGLNPLIIPKIIRSLWNLFAGSGYGKIQIFMQARVVTEIKGEETVKVQEKASI